MSGISRAEHVLKVDHFACREFLENGIYPAGNILI
jgi:hypothetical protein